MPATGWANHDAAVYVARHTEIPAAERKTILAMLGILGPDQASIAPDPTAPGSPIHVSLPGVTTTVGDTRPPSARRTR